MSSFVGGVERANQEAVAVRQYQRPGALDSKILHSWKRGGGCSSGGVADVASLAGSVTAYLPPRGAEVRSRIHTKSGSVLDTVVRPRSTSWIGKRVTLDFHLWISA